jgi:hypothetical protein
VRALPESLRNSRRYCNVGPIGGQGGAFVRSLLLMVLATLAFHQPGRAQAADEVPPEQQVLILSRALVYDDNFKERVGPDVRVAVMARQGNSASETSAAAMLKAWKGVGNLKLAGLPLRVTAIAYKDTATFAPLLASEAIDVLYICPGLEANLAEIFDLTRKRRVVTVGSREDHVKKGAALGVFLVNNRPTIMVNLPASKTEGASFSSDLLRLATVIK